MVKRTTINISAETLTELQTIAGSAKAERRQVERAKIILQWHEGKTFAEAKMSLGVTETAINKWRKRFKEKGMEGLIGAPKKWQTICFHCCSKSKCH